MTAPGKIWRAGTLTYTTGGLVLLCFWLLWGDFPWAMKDRAVGPSATLLIKQLGVSDFLYGLIIVGFPNFTNTFLSPAISYISDRHRGRWGRRIPFLLFTTPFIVFGIYLMGLTHLLGGWLHEGIPALPEHHAKLIVFCIGWILLDFGATLSASLFNALANDVVPKEVLGRFFALFRMVSLAADMIYNAWLINKVENHALEILFGVGTFYGIGLLSLCWKVKEGEYPPPEAEPPLPGGAGKKRTLLLRVAHSAADYLRQSFSLPYYRWYMAASAVASLAFTPVNFFSIQYAQKLNLGMDRYGIYLVITYCCSLVISFTLGILSDRFHPLRTGLAALILYAVLMFASFALMADAVYFGVLFILHGVVSGSFFTLTASLGSRLLPHGLFAQFSSAGGIVFAAGSMVMGPALGKTLDLLHQDYRYVFLIGGFVTVAAIGLFVKIYHNYLEHGGDQGYRPPMPE